MKIVLNVIQNGLNTYCSRYFSLDDNYLSSMVNQTDSF